MAAARSVSEKTLAAVLNAIERNPSATDEQLGDVLGLRPATIYSALLALQNRQLIKRESTCTIWIRTTPPWLVQ